MENLPLVSCVIPTKNSEEFLWLVLKNLQHQTYKNKEIIIVDNYSTDSTRRIAYGLFDLIFVKGNERAEQDNYAIFRAKGEIIYLTGSDLIADDNYIEQGVKKIQEGYDAVYASVLTDRRVRHFWGKVKALERQCYIGDNTIESARFFKKEVWEKLGGFDEKLVQVEEDFQHRLDKEGYKTGRIQAKEYHLHEEESLKKVFSKSKYYGQFMPHYVRKHNTRGIKQLIPIRWAFIRNWKLLLSHPILTIGLVIYKFVQYSGGIIGCYQKRK